MRSRDEVLDGALRTLNADPTASMSDVATAIGIGRATLHRHFATRDALLHEIGERSLDRWAQSQADAGMVAATGTGDATALEACLRAMLPAFVQDAEDFDFALHDPTMLAMPDLVARTRTLQALEVAFFRAAQEADVVRRDVPAVWLSHAVYGLLVASQEALRAGDVARRPLADLLVTTFLEGAAPR